MRTCMQIYLRARRYQCNSTRTNGIVLHTTLMIRQYMHVNTNHAYIYTIVVIVTVLTTVVQASREREKRWKTCSAAFFERNAELINHLHDRNFELKFLRNYFLRAISDLSEFGKLKQSIQREIGLHSDSGGVGNTAAASSQKRQAGRNTSAEGSTTSLTVVSPSLSSSPTLSSPHQYSAKSQEERAGRLAATQLLFDFLSPSDRFLFCRKNINQLADKYTVNSLDFNQYTDNRAESQHRYHQQHQHHQYMHNQRPQKRDAQQQAPASQSSPPTQHYHFNSSGITASSTSEGSFSSTHQPNPPSHIPVPISTPTPTPTKPTTPFHARPPPCSRSKSYKIDVNNKNTNHRSQSDNQHSDTGQKRQTQQFSLSLGPSSSSSSSRCSITPTADDDRNGGLRPKTAPDCEETSNDHTR